MSERSAERFLPGLAGPAFWVMAMLSAGKLDIWNAGFASVSAPIVLSNILKLCVVVMGFVWVCALGSAFLGLFARVPRDARHAGELAVAGMTGLCLVSLANFLCGALGLYRFWTYAPAVVLGSWFLRGHAALVSRRIVSIAGALAMRREEGCAVPRVVAAPFVLTAVAVTLYVFLAKGMYPDFGGDVLYYMEYFRNAVRDGSIFPGRYDQLVYFPTKFSGLHYVFNILFDPSYAAAASVVYYAVLAVCLADFMYSCTGSVLYVTVAHVTFSAGASFLVFTNNFSKANFPASVSVAYFAYLLWSQAREDSRRVRAALYVQSVAVALATSIVVAFAALYGLMAAVLAVLRRRPWRACAAAALLPLAAYVLVACVNFLKLGVADISLMDKQVRYGILPAASTYLYDGSCVFFLKFFEGAFSLVGSWAAYFGNLGQLVFQDIALRNAYSPWGWALAVSGLAAGALLPRLRRASGPAWAVMALLGAQLGLCAVLMSRSIMAHSTFLFGMVFAAAAHALGLSLASRALFRDNALRRKVFDTAASAFAVAVAFAAFPHNLADDVRERMEFLRGLKSYHSVYAGYYPEISVCDAVEALVGPERRILPLSPFSPCPPYTNEHILDPLTSFFGADSRPLAQAPPGEARDILLRHGVDRVIVDFEDQATWYVFLSPFHPGAIRNSCSGVISLGKEKYLLALGGGGEGGAPDKAFMEKYETFYAKALRSPARELHGRILDNAVADSCVSPRK